ncbi:hypothetical protein IYQ_05433 [Aeromonas salmonicida subsp. salmonicida 01-B526]|uniref:Uncharacterized protein n=1 Tax=Aeromonas salmonicida subsp. salmonicida 01-B526 TaxID=1076135 RepID=A0ABP2N3M2_AERSS|nr:hypothetical protein IYQ_05433 [Aeromonas salmonicida subsp. salmonicida 01-B526]SPT73007.1 Uncharacterised protein [Aeromonas salmonicida]
MLSLLLQGGELELQPLQQFGAGLLHVVLAQVAQPRQGSQQIGRPFAVSLGTGLIRTRNHGSLLAVAQQRPGLGGQFVLGILQQPLAVARELARRQIIAIDTLSHLLEQGAQRGCQLFILLCQLAERQLTHRLGFGQAQGIAAAQVVAQGALQGIGQPLLQPFMLMLGLLGLIQLLPAMKQGADLYASDQQQYQGGEGGIVGNFHVRIPA